MMAAAVEKPTGLLLWLLTPEQCLDIRQVQELLSDNHSR